MTLKYGIFTALFIAGMALPAAAQTKIAFVDIDKVTEKSDKINKAMGSVQDRVKEIQDGIETRRKKLVELRADIKKGEGVLAESEMKKKRDEASKVEKEMSDLEYEGRREMQKLDSTLFEPMVKTIQLAIQDVAKEQNIDLVVRGEAVIYGAPSVDISESVIKKLNSSAYNPGVTSDDSSSDNKPATHSSDDDESKTESSSSAKSAKKPESSTAASSTDSNKKEIFPVPLVTRPVDRQSE